MTIFYTPPFPNPCAGAPTVDTPTLSDIIAGTCFSTGWVVSCDIGVTGSLTGYELEIWTKEWKDAESEPSNFTFQSRHTSTGTKTIEVNIDFSDAGTGASETRRRKARVYVVPDWSADGAGPFCDSADSSQLNRTSNICEPE